MFEKQNFIQSTLTSSHVCINFLVFLLQM